VPDRKSVTHLEKMGFDTSISEVGEMLATYANDKNKRGAIKRRAVLLEFLKSQSRTLDFHSRCWYKISEHLHKICGSPKLLALLMVS